MVKRLVIIVAAVAILAWLISLVRILWPMLG